MSASGALLTARPFAGLAAFDALAETWDGLRRASGADGLCNSHGWTRLHLEAFGHGDALFGWIFEEAGQPVGAAAFRPEPSRGLGTLPRVIQAADGTFDSDYLVPLALPGREDEVAGALLEALTARGGVQAVVLAVLPDEAPLGTALRRRLAEERLSPREHPVPCLSAPLPETFDAYLAGLKKRMRTKVRSAMRKSEARGGRLLWCEERPEEHLEPFFAQHTARWNALGQPGSFADPARRRFYHALTPWLAERGALRFARLEQDGQAVAYQYGALVEGRYYQLQEGYLPALEGERVGTALRGLAVADLIEAGVREYDFMAGDSKHKRDWGATDRGTRTLAFPLPRLWARMAYGLRARLEALRG